MTGYNEAISYNAAISYNGDGAGAVADSTTRQRDTRRWYGGKQVALPEPNYKPGPLYYEEMERLDKERRDKEEAKRQAVETAKAQKKALKAQAEEERFTRKRKQNDEEALMLLLMMDGD